MNSPYSQEVSDSSVPQSAVQAHSRPRKLYGASPRGVLLHYIALYERNITAFFKPDVLMTGVIFLFNGAIYLKERCNAEKLLMY